MSNDQIQPSLTRNSFNPAGRSADPETSVDRRGQTPEEEKRWWKRAAMIGFALFFLAFTGGTIVTVGGSVMYRNAINAIKRQEEQFRIQEEQFRIKETFLVRQAEEARQNAFLARQAAELAKHQTAEVQVELRRARQKAAEVQIELERVTKEAERNRPKAGK